MGYSAELDRSKSTPDHNPEEPLDHARACTLRSPRARVWANVTQKGAELCGVWRSSCSSSCSTWCSGWYEINPSGTSDENEFRKQKMPITASTIRGSPGRWARGRVGNAM